jgi:aldose 1-epimerase
LFEASRNAVQTLTLSQGPWRAEVVPERGGRMTRLSFDGAEVLEPVVDWTPPGRPWPAAGLYPLVPYSNRIEHGRLSVGGRAVQLAIHPFAAPHAVHGPGHRRAWSVAARTPHEVRLHLAYAPDDDWPWAFESTLTYALHDDAVLCTIDLMNRSAEAMPAGLGLHPFFHAPDGTRYSLAHRDRWPQTEADAPLPQFSEQARRIDDVVSQDGLIACLGRWDGAATIARPDLSIQVEASSTLAHLIVYRAAGSAFLCLEPVSHATNAFNHHGAGRPHSGATFLGPGERMEGRMVLRCATPRPS